MNFGENHRTLKSEMLGIWGDKMAPPGYMTGVLGVYSEFPYPEAARARIAAAHSSSLLVGVIKISLKCFLVFVVPLICQINEPKMRLNQSKMTLK